LHELDGRNWRAGKSDIFLLEACEYRRSFAAYTPHDILLTNCDGDHFDYYESPEDYRSAFIDFAKKLPEDGTLITHQTDQNCQAVCVAANRSTLNADTFPFVTLHTPGLHMRQNAQLVLGLASVLGIEPTKAQAAVAGYAGSWRRMERKGTMGNAAIVIDDYAHHPVEIRATLAALKSAYPDRRLVCIFQPHTHDRTIKLYEDFLDAFREADLLIVSSVYEARSDIETQKVKMKKFVSDIQKASNVRTIDGGSLEDIRKNLPSLSQSSDLVVCMGAGDITALAATLTQQ
jgi:UDP-N-acetylmuramate--alanine ligase